MKTTTKYRFVLKKLLTLIPVIGLSMTTGCGGGSTFSGGNIFSDGCKPSDPEFPFCGQDIVRCTNQDKTLYQVFDAVCPIGWTVVPEGVAFPHLACTNPEGQTFNVDAARCPPGWTEFTFTLTL